MPSKTSKVPKLRYSPWKQELGCDEGKTREVARALTLELKLGDRVILEGPLGAGKSTFARFLLEALGVRQPPEGSPTFSLAHEYDGAFGPVIHIDFYRLRSEDEIEDAGISSYFWERKAIVICEWLSNWPVFESDVLDSGRCFRITLQIKGDNVRDLILEKTKPL